MSQLPETINGYDAPHSTQFSVFLDNRVGKMYELLKIFDGVKLRMVALNVIDSSDHAVVRLITSNSTLAHKLLVENKNAFSECPILLVEFGQGLTLAKLCMTLLSAEISIHYAYSLLIRPHNTACPNSVVREQHTQCAYFRAQRHSPSLSGNNTR